MILQSVQRSAMLALCSLLLVYSGASEEEQCLGLRPMESVKNYLGATLDYSVAEHICCNNHRYAERWGYLAAPEVDFFSRLDPTVETVFYDSVCGIPLFVAPRNRTFEEFREESLHHGWPSFRPAEIIAENVIIHPYGRMESKCRTHLGHNLPQNGVDRYCIDLVCIAGKPLDVNTTEDEVSDSLSTLSTSVAIPEGTITAEELDIANYVSSAEQNSGKTTGRKIRMGVIIGVVLLVAVVALLLSTMFFNKKQQMKKQAMEATKQEAADTLSNGTGSVEEN